MAPGATREAAVTKGAIPQVEEGRAFPSLGAPEVRSCDKEAKGNIENLINQEYFIRHKSLLQALLMLIQK